MCKITFHFLQWMLDHANSILILLKNGILPSSREVIMSSNWIHKPWQYTVTMQAIY
jgi:hypothetical protein